MKTKPKIITIGGLPGSGKTTLADALAAHMTKHGTKAVSIDSDRVRKELWGYEETARLPEEAYTWEATKHVIFETQNQVQDALNQEITVIQSAAFMTEHSRQKQEEYAETIDTDHIGLFLTCDTEELEHRITLRTEKNDSASDAGIDILKKFLKTYKEGHIQDWININANKTQDKVLSDVLKILKIPSHMHSLSKPSRFPKRSL